MKKGSIYRVVKPEWWWRHFEAQEGDILIFLYDDGARNYAYFLTQGGVKVKIPVHDIPYLLSPIPGVENEDG